MMRNSKLYQAVTSEKNIFAAIYSLESYIFEKKLLNKDDLDLLNQLSDKYDDNCINDTINKCKERLDKVLLSDAMFDIKVYFKAKKYENEKIEFRPLHTADLITQICIVSILNVIMFSTASDGKRQLSDLSQLLPSNFYGNLPSTEYENIFFDWQGKYKEYAENVVSEYEQIKKNNSFKYEVALDLEKFFPSVDPSFIYNFILEKTSSIYNNEDTIFLKLMLTKILHFRVVNLKTQADIDEYYSTSKLIDETKGIHKEKSCIMNIGIPQGLPQAYYFGNIAMIVISKEFDKMFKGKSFYYVDDSVIYTNEKSASSDNFKATLQKLNKNIKTQIAKYIKEDEPSKNNILYNVAVHTQEKSSSAEVDSDIKMSKVFLVGVGLEASRVSFDINNTMNEIQDISIKEKIENIFDALEVEIENVKSQIDNLKKSVVDGNNNVLDTFKIYLKSLIRYKKFFGYRKKILEFRENDSIDEIMDAFCKKYINKTNDLEAIFQSFDEDIFIPEASMILNELAADDKEKFVKQLAEFEAKLAPNLSVETRYFTKIFSENIDYPNFCFCTLKKVSSDHLGKFMRAPEEKINYKLELIVIQEKSIWLGFDNKSYNQEIFNNSKKYKRNILNSYISRVFNIDVTQDIEFIKKDKRPLKYYELRILMYVRNTNIHIDELIQFLTTIIQKRSDKNYEKVDFSMIEVLDIFRTYVRDAELIDNLILVHKYVSSVWRNGSRFLYFYTLHNQEHSVELIKSSVNICKLFDFMQIKSFDYYILFLACYLHDISMILQPSIESFLENNSQTDELYTSFLEFKHQVFSDSEICEEHFDNKSNVKNVMKFAFEQVNYYFESLSRDTHVAASANFIKITSDLKFIEPPIRKIVSSVSAAHGFGVVDVYGLKSNATTDVVSEKYMMILLRIADLLDIAKDRVSLEILDRNIANMPEISQYHWITHSAIDKFEIRTKYKFNNDSGYKGDFETVLKRENFIETIKIYIYLNTSNLTNVSPLNCKDVSAKLSQSRGCIEIDIGRGKTCEYKCNFLCKWICHKNAYLLPEMNALQEYIKRTPNLNFTTKIKIILDFSNTQKLKNDYFDIVSKQLQ